MADTPNTGQAAGQTPFRAAKYPLVELDISVEELLEALNDQTKLDALLKQRGWTPDDVIARAERTAKAITLAATDLSRV